MISWPPFSIPQIVNETSGEITEEYESFWDMISYLGTGIVVVPFVGLLENMNAVKTFGKQNAVLAFIVKIPNCLLFCLHF